MKCKRGEIDTERKYLLKQEAELYPKVERFIESMSPSDLTDKQLTDIWKEATTDNFNTTA